MAQWHPYTDISGLLVPMFSGGPDEYGHEIVPPAPLAFDRVNEGRAPKSNAPLLRLPLEVLGHISDYVSRDSLAAFALVNTDCRQLARSRQFASVLLDYSDASLGLIKKLLGEGLERRESDNNLTRTPSLGACIRRITIATSRGWLCHRHGIGFATLEPLGETERAERLEDAGRAFFKVYIPSIQAVLCESLPHLELLDWEDKISMPPSMYTALACSPVRHLKLYRVRADEEFEVGYPPSIVTPIWPLRTLYLELLWNFIAPAKGSTSRLCASILRLCASTLESLVWISFPGEHDEAHSLGPEPPTFPVLRVLKLGNFAFADSSVLDALISAPGARCHLRTLSVDTEANEIYSQFFERRGAIPSLEAFIWDTFSIPDTHSLAFLESNPQLSKLSFTYETSPYFLDTRVLPLLSRSFTHLTSLDLSWAGPSISSAALQLLSTLTSLQQLQLSAGAKYGWRHDWTPNHDTLRKHLSTLPNLAKLALSRDTFRPDYDWIDADSYYSARIFRPRDAEEQAVADWIASRDTDEPGDAEESFHDQAWEMVHRKRVLAEAEKYVREMPRLEWLYFGQIPMGVVESNSDSSKVGRKVAVPLFEKRDDCYTLLSRMFGRETALG